MGNRYYDSNTLQGYAKKLVKEAPILAESYVKDASDNDVILYVSRLACMVANRYRRKFGTRTDESLWIDVVQDCALQALKIRRDWLKAGRGKFVVYAVNACRYIAYHAISDSINGGMSSVPFKMLNRVFALPEYDSAVTWDWTYSVAPGELVDEAPTWDGQYPTTPVGLRDPAIEAMSHDIMDIVQGVLKDHDFVRSRELSQRLRQEIGTQSRRKNRKLAKKKTASAGKRKKSLIKRKKIKTDLKLASLANYR